MYICVTKRKRIYTYGNSPILFSKIALKMQENFPDLVNILRETMDGPMTAFLISDEAVDNLSDETDQFLQTNSALLKKVREHIQWHV